MSSRSLVAASVALLAASPSAAQRPADPDARLSALLARAESLAQVAASADRAQRTQSAAARRGQVLRAGRLVLVYWESVTPEIAQRIALRADSVLEAFGGGLVESLDSIVGVEANVSDTARLLSAPTLRRRTPVELDVVKTAADSTNASIDMVNRIARHYAGRLDATWRSWLSSTYGVYWQQSVNPAWALPALTNPSWSSGSGCLAGRLAECRLWLGLDPAERPMAVRYHTVDLRRWASELRFGRGGEARDACVADNDAACLQFAESRQLLPRIPAPDIAREGLVRAMWTLHGPGAVSRAFRDTVGGIGERFARATGIGEDSLVSEWRIWTLARGRTERLEASLPQVLAVVFAALLVVFLATRSGRWR